ncbi:hypothetical protein KQH49_06485 [Mycetohabitans sp. B5]|uniref:Uncharacterized protein n=1 Tax=Mycetohabitans endofungorum TaxID=417203 RepID=A0A2P5K7C3_9BURK|nr:MULTISPECIES: hypothetical protein [Mycetohabitans]MCG1054617.1 hypothetical protein [Mycetohabitans sp. B5]PPB81952.1 hypothetical protein B0O95_11610 [Mycetohabitans endofungorum]
MINPRQINPRQPAPEIGRRRHLDPAAWVGVIIVCIVAGVLATVLFNALSGKREYDAEHHQAAADAARAVSATLGASAAVSASPARVGVQGAPAVGASAAMPAPGSR